MEEHEEILIAMTAIVFAVYNLFWGLYPGLFHPEVLSRLVVLSFTIGIAFIAHEMGHKWAAEQFGTASRFVMWSQGIIFMMLTSFFGFLFAAPGAVYIFARNMPKEQEGIISVAGPSVNILLYSIFALILIGSGIFGYVLTDILKTICALGLQINAFLALFNLLPFFILDGAKVFRWNKSIWAVAFFGAILMLFLSGFFMGFAQ